MYNKQCKGRWVMPFKSEAQRRYLFMKHPSIAKRWADKYGTPKNLPYHKKEKKSHVVEYIERKGK